MKSFKNYCEFDECWTGYVQRGMKKKGDRMVPNCVPAGSTKEEVEVDEGTGLQVKMALGDAGVEGHFDGKNVRVHKKHVEKAKKALKGNVYHRGKAPNVMAHEEVDLDEAEYQGRDVPLNKRLPGDVKKSKVFVKNAAGRVVKVNFGDKNMTIKKDNPARRRSFRARHNCDNPGPKTKARYWSCKAW